MGFFGVVSVSKIINSAVKSTVDSLSKTEVTEDKFNNKIPEDIKTFTRWVKELALYLGNFHRAENLEIMIAKEEKLISINDYDKHALTNSAYEKGLICVAGGKGTSSNIYVQAVILNIFPLMLLSHDNVWKPAYYNCKLSEYKCGWDYGHITPRFEWRDDITNDLTEIDPYTKVPTTQKTWFADVLKYIQEDTAWDNRKYYNIFWNLFLLALDDDIRNKQLAGVADLAHCFKFTEPMLRDWCRAVEYVMNGNQLSEGCDLKCETVEGRRFFLHKNE